MDENERTDSVIQRYRLSLCISGTLLAAVTMAGPAVAATTISFSADEQSVTIQYPKGTWSFRRPVVSRWSYTPTRRIFWVAPTGSDAATGSSTLPLRTLSKAISL